MLKLKSVVKTREQLLSTGWVEDRSGSFSNTEIHRGHLHVKPEMLGRPYNGVVKDFTHKCTLEGVSGIWTLCPEMMLVTDQWGFVREPVTRVISMWDGLIGRWVGVYGLPGKENFIRTDVHVYTNTGQRDVGEVPVLSKYPCSLQYGGYTPFDFEELKEAFNCKKTTDPATPSDSGNSTKPDSCRSTVAPKGYGDTEVNAEAQVKDESGSATLEDLFGEKETQIWSEISTRERIVNLLERLENLRSSNLPGVKEKVEAVMLDMVKKLVV